MIIRTTECRDCGVEWLETFRGRRCHDCFKIYQSNYYYANHTAVRKAQRALTIKKRLKKYKPLLRGAIKKNVDREVYVPNNIWLRDTYYLSFDYLSDVRLEHLTFNYWKTLDDEMIDRLQKLHKINIREMLAKKEPSPED